MLVINMNFYNFLSKYTLIFLMFSANSFALESAAKCSGNECVKSSAELIIDNNDVTRVDTVIDLVKSVEDGVVWKKNMLGALYLIKKDPSSIETSEKYLLDAFEDGSKSSVHNLAELYFFKDDYTKSIYYLNLEKEFNYKYPSINYVDWARLYAQHLYFGLPTIQDIKSAINLFKEICSLDKTGTAYYFLALDLIENKNMKDGIFYLQQAVEAKNLNAILLFGDLNYEGESIEKDWGKAKEYFLLASEFNSDRAHMNLAVIYQSEKDAEKMKFHLTQAAKLGNKQARALFEKLNSK
jgi:TPR repeat protein